jgi:hypothetical protein
MNSLDRKKIYLLYLQDIGRYSFQSKSSVAKVSVQRPIIPQLIAPSRSVFRLAGRLEVENQRRQRVRQR